MKYFHRSHLGPDAVLQQASRFFGGRMALAAQEARRWAFNGPVGAIAVRAEPDGGHYTMITVETDQVGESEADKLAKRFLTMVHTSEDSTHSPIGAY